MYANGTVLRYVYVRMWLRMSASCPRLSLQVWVCAQCCAHTADHSCTGPGSGAVRGLTVPTPRCLLCLPPALGHHPHRGLPLQPAASTTARLVSLDICTSISLFVLLSANLFSICLSICLTIHLTICLYVCLSVCLCTVCLSVCLYLT